MQFQMPNLQVTFSVGTILLIASIFIAAWKVARVIRKLAEPIRTFVGEHDILWEDFNVRTGGTYRRSEGRGSKPSYPTSRFLQFLSPAPQRDEELR